jgi:aconitate hydratase
VWIGDVWPNSQEIEACMHYALDPKTFRRLYKDFSKGNDLWNAVLAPSGQVYDWPKSSYIARPPFFDDFSMTPSAPKPIRNGRALLVLGDSVTTDHISPAGSFKASTPAGKWLEAGGVAAADFNSYGSRRGHHEVMIRGTFANVRVKNLMLPPKEDGSRIEGGYTLLEGQRTTVYEAAMAYQKQGTPTFVFAGEEYGTGSSRDWAAKGTQLLGIKAVVAKSFERIHRSNLVGMGVVPLQFLGDDSAQSLGITGVDETFDLLGLEGEIQPQQDCTLVIRRKNGQSQEVKLRLRIDTAIEVDYFRHGGILPFVLRQLLQA